MALLATSDELVEELQTSDVLVLSVPIYNFSVPATLKAYIDLVDRAGVTFRYGENGPVGLLKDRKTYVVVTSGGIPLGSDFDDVSGYVRQVLAFLGITDVEFVAADQLARDPEAAVMTARQQIGESLEQVAVAV
ncbi:MAG: FMN-dependent NADH-azoreductase [Chloroflexi bacterium AL-W]|nr:FMN-dependent NADH-azoreductase [Chloroflexi bacterium AL-N1]NOK67975.1 FMN-dependent NADH-azoreductase [Chloroflexi bacterium AL-N10]NOK73315.1 FMN-dependent NADH-azoreductase [Chloroflexi bacterium AL-N5]NOK83229.1 FMN-dependent NADH-azoreductase [Chloroflexi bacterium AL-W]NOK87646.1 FMN-dependent NADH-azoreductase [Chloroflexi bacterium AL-N15]